MSLCSEDVSDLWKVSPIVLANSSSDNSISSNLKVKPEIFMFFGAKYFFALYISN